MPGVKGHVTDAMDVITYFSVVNRETICIALMWQLHDLEVKAADKWNAYVMASKREMMWK